MPLRLRKGGLQVYAVSWLVPLGLRKGSLKVSAVSWLVPLGLQKGGLGMAFWPEAATHTHMCTPGGSHQAPKWDTYKMVPISWAQWALDWAGSIPPSQIPHHMAGSPNCRQSFCLNKNNSSTPFTVSTWEAPKSDPSALNKLNVQIWCLLDVLAGVSFGSIPNRNALRVG